MNLYPTEQKLVQALRGTGPARWCLNVSNAAQAYVYRIMAAYMTEEVNYQQAAGETPQALVIGPAANMHRWWDGGWKGAYLTSVKFMNAPMPLKPVGIVCFDRQIEYPQKYLAALDVFLVDHAQHAIFLLPPEPSLELGRVLAKHRFIHVNVT